MRVYTRTPVIDRIMAKVELQGDCWVWTGAVGSSGYGHIGDGEQRTVSTHRTVWEHYSGPIPNGLVLDHLCGVIRCCNPEHLEPVTQEENRRRQSARRTECDRGHAYTPENTRVTKNGRECRRCCADRERARRAKVPRTSCPGHQRHWFTVYREPGNQTPTCQRCGAPNPRHALFAAVKDGGLPDPMSRKARA